MLRGLRGWGRGGPCQITKKSQGTNVSSVVFFTCIYLYIHLCYRFPPFLTKSASDSVVLTHLNNLFGSKLISSLEKKLPKLFVIFSSVHASHHSLKPGLSSITTAIPGVFPFPFFFFSSLFVWGSSEDNSEEFFRACKGLHRIEGNLGQVEELYCGNSTINPRLCKEAESVPGPAPTCAAATRPWNLHAGSARVLCFVQIQLCAIIPFGISHQSCLVTCA